MIQIIKEALQERLFDIDFIIEGETSAKHLEVLEDVKKRVQEVLNNLDNNFQIIIKSLNKAICWNENILREGIDLSKEYSEDVQEEIKTFEEMIELLEGKESC